VGLTGRPLVLFGSGAVARMVRYLLEQESEHKVVAITLDRDHLAEAGPSDLPLVPFEELTDHYPPSRFPLFIAVGYRQMNGLRATRYRVAKRLGYELITHVSPRASTWPDLEIGENCLVMDNTVVQPFSRIGNDCILWSGSHIAHEARLGDHCYVAARAVVSGFASVGERTFLGTGSIIRDGITVGDRCLIGAGAVITHDVPADSILAASPARTLPGTSDRLPGF
jgi:sugar O-acyltransferase (sialic acid O-acetyltransferase NeuD family)